MSADRANCRRIPRRAIPIIGKVDGHPWVSPTNSIHGFVRIRLRVSFFCVGWGCPVVSVVSLAFNLAWSRLCWLRLFRLVRFCVWCLSRSFLRGRKASGAKSTVAASAGAERAGAKSAAAEIVGVGKRGRAKSGGDKRGGGYRQGGNRWGEESGGAPQSLLLTRLRYPLPPIVVIMSFRLMRG